MTSRLENPDDLEISGNLTTVKYKVLPVDLMKLILANGANICELVFVRETEVFNACFN